MSKTKLTLLLCLVTVLSMSAVASSSASAHEFLIEGTEIKAGEKFELNGPGVGVGGIKVKIDALEFIIGGVRIQQKCPEYTLTLTLEPGNNTKWKQVSDQCQLYKINAAGRQEEIPQCTVKETLEGTDKMTGNDLDTFTFVASSLIIAGAGCPYSNTYTLVGKELCAITEAEFSKVLHEIICTPAGSEVEVEGEVEKVKVKESAQLFFAGQDKLTTGQVWTTN